MSYSKNSRSRFTKVDTLSARLRSSYINSITCTDDECPLFQGCPQIPSQGQRTGNRDPKVFFVFASPSEEDAIKGLPAVSQQGQYFRDKWLTPFLRDVGSPPYQISNVVRSPLQSNGKTRWPTPVELQSCWPHFMDEYEHCLPKALVVFGNIAYASLYKQALNKSEIPKPDDYGIKKLRKMDIEIELVEGHKTRVFVGYTPGFILSSPASAGYFEEDMKRVVYYFKPSKEKKVDHKIVSIDKVDLLDNTKDVLEFMDFLYRGLPRDQMFDLSFDTETANLNRMYNNKFLSWQFTWKAGHAVVIPVEHRAMPLFADIKQKLKLIDAFQKVLSSSPEQTRIRWIVAHNAKFDFSVLYGLLRIINKGTIPIWDTFLGMHWLDENRKQMIAVLEGKPYALETLGSELLHFKYKEGQKEARTNLEALDFDDFVEYGGTDTILTWHLKQKQQELAAEQKNQGQAKLERFMRSYYSPATRALSLMECNGLYVAQDQLDFLMGEDSPIWNRIESIENKELQESPEVLAFRKEHKKTIQGESNIEYEDDLWGDPSDEEEAVLPFFDPNKKDQEHLFYLEYLGLKPLAFSKKTKKPKLDKDFLKHHAEEYLTLPAVKPFLKYYTTEIGRDGDDPIFPKNPLQLILEYREVKKLGTTYLTGIDNMVNDRHGDCIDRRVRASFHLAGTDTGRLCLRYDSRISVVGDTKECIPPTHFWQLGKQIKDVKVGDLVYCYDDQKKLQIRKVLWQGKTGTKKLLRLHWEAGNNRKTGHLDLTPEHRVRLLDGSYKMAKDLQPKDRLLTLARSLIKPNFNKKNYYSRLYTPTEMVQEHRFIYESIHGDKAQTVHHKDGNSLNNEPTNLVATTTSKHTSDHLREHWKNGVFANRPTKGEGHYLYNHQGKFTFLKELAKVKGHRKSPEGLASTGLIKNSESFKKRCELFGIDTKIVAMRYDGHGEYISRGRMQTLLQAKARYKIQRELGIGEKTVNKLISYYGLDEYIQFKRNHTVVSIEELYKEYDVYDLEVEDCHNFIANEICVHNSSSKPNFQNLPSGRSKMAKEIKNLFQAQAPSKLYPNGTALIQLDYKTAEVRWAAIFANDKNLISLFNDARKSLEEACSPSSTMTDEEFSATQLASDIHRRTASLMFGVPPKDVIPAMRQASKSITFGLLFGMSEQTLASNNGWTEKEADDRMKKFFSAFPDLEMWLAAIPKRAKSNGFVETIMGRRRRLNILFDTGQFRDDAKASRLAKNAPIQGQSSDGGTLGVCDFLQYLLDNKLERRWLIQNVVHDSCLVQVPMEDVEKAIKVMQHCFVQGMADYIKKHFNFTLPLPIECDIEVGLKYGDLIGWDGRPSTIPSVLEYLDKSAKKLWYTKKNSTGKPSSNLDLVNWQGN